MHLPGGGVFLCDLGQLAKKSLRDGGSRGVEDAVTGWDQQCAPRSMMFFNLGTRYQCGSFPKQGYPKMDKKIFPIEMWIIFLQSQFPCPDLEVIVTVNELLGLSQHVYLHDHLITKFRTIDGSSGLPGVCSFPSVFTCHVAALQMSSLFGGCRYLVAIRYQTLLGDLILKIVSNLI